MSQLQKEDSDEWKTIRNQVAGAITHINMPDVEKKKD